VAMGSLMHSRGCPWRCGFCSSRRFWNERVRFRSADNVVDEILKVHKDFGIRVFTFWDDAFTIDRRLTEALCEAILRSPLKIAWRTATRLDLLDDSMLRLMRRAGCFQVELGIETGSPRMSEIIRKDIDLALAPEIIDKANRHGIACGVFLMAGFPDETRDDLLQTLAFMKRIKPAEIVLNILDPMPGSEQFDRAVELNLIHQPIDFTRFSLWPDAHFMTNISAEEFNALIEEISHYVFRYNSSRTALFRRARPEILQLMRTDRAVLLQKATRFIQRRFLRN
jgi:anaerobic magnesium-protoporphyrin IX monomethyl ester cyclase